MDITHVFFDIGGVLGTNGWDREQRARAIERFGLDKSDFQYRHETTVGALEEGRITLDEYLDLTVFCSPREFSRDDFRNFMFAQSHADSEAITIARAVAALGRYRMMTLNNESAELNAHRIAVFGLGDMFDAFLSSCWLRVSKPTRMFYDLALSIAHANPSASLFIDDREQNLTPAKALGMQVIHFTSADLLRGQLAAAGIKLNSEGT